MKFQGRRELFLFLAKFVAVEIQLGDEKGVENPKNKQTTSIRVLERRRTSKALFHSAQQQLQPASFVLFSAGIVLIEDDEP